jgi:PAS domain S-box-containing protein
MMNKNIQNKPGFGILACMATAVMAFLAGKFLTWWALSLFLVMALISWQTGMIRWRILQDRIADQSMTLDRLKSLLAHSPNPMSIFDEQGRYLDVSEATARSAGTSREGLRGKRFSEVWPREVTDEFMKTLGELHREKRLIVKEDTVPAEDGGIIFKTWLFPVQSCPDGPDLYGAVSIDITAEKMARAALVESEKRYRGLVESQSDLIVRVDDQNRLTYVNETYCRTFGKTREELTGNSFTPLVHEEDLEKTLKAMEKLKSPPYRCQVEQRAMTVNGWRWLHWEDNAILGEDGQIVEIQGVGRDITDLKNVEETLRITDKRLSMAQSFAHAGVWEYDIKTDLLHWSKECEDLFGLDHGEFEGTYEAFLERVHPEDRDYVMETNRPITQHNEGIPLEYEHRIVRKDGMIRWVRESAGVVRDEAGNPVRIVGFAIDITEARIQQEKLRLILEAAQNVSFIITEPSDQGDDAIIREFSPGAENLFRYKKEEILGWSVSALHSENDVKKFPAIHFSLKQGKPWKDKLTLVRKSGEMFPALFTAYPFEIGNKQHGLGVSVDITELEDTRKQLVQAMEKTLAANRAKSLFLANMSHEIRSPMSGIVGALEMLAHRIDDQKSRNILDMARQTARSLEVIINDILDLSRVEAGKLEIVENDFDPAGLLDRIISLFSGRAESKGIRLTGHVSREVPAVLRGDPHRLEQVLNNLVDNALKFTETGEVKVDVQALGTFPESISLCFKVTDTGPGVPDEFRSELFDDFTQADNTYTKKFRGTGLGLAISSRLVRLMGGTMEVESVPGQGSTFSFTLPFGAVKKTVQEQDGEAAGAGPDSPVELRPLNILVAEDSELNREYMSFILKRAGHRAVFAAGGEEAVQAFEPGKYDLVIMDIQMPDISGLEAAQRIRKIEQSSRDSGKTPVMALTAYAMPLDKNRFLSAGMDGYISKPFTAKALFREMARLVEHNDEAGSLASGRDNERGCPVDMDRVRDRYLGNTEFWQRSLNRFVSQELPRYLHKVRQSVEQGRLDDLAGLIHKLSGTLGTICAMKGHQKALDLHQALGEGDEDRIEALSRDLIHELEALMTWSQTCHSS